jgi:hypothetical protein
MRSLRVLVGVALAVCLGVGSAWAQSAGGGGRGAGRHGRGGAPTPALPDVPPVPNIWPRLDVGAVFCGTRDALIARANMVEAGAPAGQLPEGCRLIEQPTAVTVVDRVPPGSTEVRLKPGGETGWTDAFLPDAPPTVAASGG